MPTFNDLVEETLGQLRQWTTDVEQAGTLVAGINASDLSLTVDNANFVGRGVYEVEEELVYASSGNTQAATIAVAPWGRGYQGTTAASHSANVKVTQSPLVPRSRVKSTINEVIRSLYPTLFVVKTDESQTVNINTVAYELPAGADIVFDVQQQVPNWVTQQWIGIRSWRIDENADTTEFPSGRSITLGQRHWISGTLKVVYGAKPSVLANNSDDFVTVTGLPASSADLVPLGAASRLVMAAELARTQTQSLEQSQRSQLNPAGAAANAARLMAAQFADRLQQERQALMIRVGGPRIVRSWK